MVKSEKFDHLHLVYYFAVPLSTVISKLLFKPVFILPNFHHSMYPDKANLNIYFIWKNDFFPHKHISVFHLSLYFWSKLDFIVFQFVLFLLFFIISYDCENEYIFRFKYEE